MSPIASRLARHMVVHVLPQAIDELVVREHARLSIGCLRELVGRRTEAISQGFERPTARRQSVRTRFGALVAIQTLVRRSELLRNLRRDL